MQHISTSLNQTWGGHDIKPTSQVAVDEATKLVARFDTLIEDMQRTASDMLKESEAAVARLQGRPTVKCTRCRVSVDVSKINLPNRCMNTQCPVKAPAKPVMPGIAEDDARFGEHYGIGT